MTKLDKYDILAMRTCKRHQLTREETMRRLHKIYRMRNALQIGRHINKDCLTRWLLNISDKCGKPITVETMLEFGNPDNSWRYCQVEGAPYWDRIIGAAIVTIMLMDVSKVDEYNAGCWWRNYGQELVAC